MLRQENIYGWDGYRWESGDISVGLVPQLGGRIMSLKFRGEEIFFVQKERAGEVFTPQELAVDKKKFGFGLWGGDKTWVAPETVWLDKIPPLDLDAGNYSFTSDASENKVTMISCICRETGLRITREIQFSSDGLILTETIKNETAAPLTRAIWNVTQVLRPFEVYFPCAVTDVRLYDDEAYRDCQPKNYLQSLGQWTGISCRDREHFKFGGRATEGKVLALRREEKRTLAFIKIFNVIPAVKYAHGSNVEVYNSPVHPYCEIEVHSLLLTLNPGQAFSQRQEWHLRSFPADVSLEGIMESITFSQFYFR